jgi:hypothetical protein
MFHRQELGGGVPGTELIGSRKSCDLTLVGEFCEGEPVIVEAKGGPASITKLRVSRAGRRWIFVKRAPVKLILSLA